MAVACHPDLQLQGSGCLLKPVNKLQTRWILAVMFNCAWTFNPTFRTALTDTSTYRHTGMLNLIERHQISGDISYACSRKTRPERSV